jgi:hypothetical protein
MTVKEMALPWQRGGAFCYLALKHGVGGMSMTWDAAAKYAPIVTASMAVLAFLGAIISILVQRRIAQKRAAIDFFLKTEMDGNMLEAHRKYKAAVEILKVTPDVAVFTQSADYVSVRSYLNVHELLAVGVHQRIFHQSVSRAYWIAELERACNDCNRLLLHLERDPAEKVTYVEMVRLNRKWQRGW